MVTAVVRNDIYQGHLEIVRFEADLKKLHKLKQATAVIESPAGRRSKFKYDHQSHVFKLDKVLPAGFVFPFDFGYLPSTLGEDGDPVDVLLLMDEPSFCGCIAECRLIGVITADQTEGSKTFRNDRLVAVSVESHEYRKIKSLKKLSKKLLDEIEFFFVAYNKIQGRGFRPLGRFGPQKAVELADRGFQLFKKKHIEN